MTGARARSLSTRTRKFKRACDWCSPSSESCKALGLSCFICAGTLFVFRFGLFLGLHPMNSSGERASASQVRYILHNPAYAGTYVYGRRTVQAAAQVAATKGRPASVKVPMDQWKVCLLSVHPGYISWEEFMANQKRLSDNANDSRSAVEAFRAEARPYSRASPSAPDAVAGCPYAIRVLTTTIPSIVVAPTKTKPRRHCARRVRATAVDDLIAQILLEALAPDQVKIAVATPWIEMTNEARQIEQRVVIARRGARSL